MDRPWRGFAPPSFGYACHVMSGARDEDFYLPSLYIPQPSSLFVRAVSPLASGKVGGEGRNPARLGHLNESVESVVSSKVCILIHSRSHSHSHSQFSSPPPIEIEPVHFRGPVFGVFF